MASINIIGSGIMSLLAKKTLNSHETTGANYPKQYADLQYSLVNAKRANWLKQHHALPEHSGEVRCIRILASDQICCIDHPEPLAYLIHHNQWSTLLMDVIQDAREPDYTAWQFIASGSEPNIILPKGIETYTHDFGQTASFTHIHHEHHHRHTATQSFTKEAIVAALPMQHPHESLIITSTPLCNAHPITTLPKEMHTFLGDYTILNQSDPQTLKSYFRYPGARGKTLLLGDSRLRLHPLAGQGLNAGLYALEDLSNRLTSIKHTLDQAIHDHINATQPHLNRLHCITRMLAITSHFPQVQQLLGLCLSLLDGQSLIKDCVKTLADPDVIYNHE